MVLRSKPTKLSRQAPTAPPRPVGVLASATLISSSATCPPWSRASPRRPRCWRCWGTSADSNPTITSAVLPSRPAPRSASRGSRMRRLAGHSFAWTMARPPPSPPPTSEAHAGRGAERGPGWSRSQASDTIPSVPSLPSTSRSGLGPAPLPGSRRDSHQPDGSASARTRRSHRCGSGSWRSGRPSVWRSSRRRRPSKRLGEVAQRQAMRAQLVLHGGAQGPGLDPGGPRTWVDLEHPVHGGQVDRHDARCRRRAGSRPTPPTSRHRTGPPRGRPRRTSRGPPRARPRPPDRRRRRAASSNWPRKARSRSV